MPKPNRPGVGGNNGQGYRDWAADLTGAGEGRQPAPRLPTQGPALTGGGQQPAPGKSITFYSTFTCTLLFFDTQNN